jgi:hypothetical protein
MKKLHALLALTLVAACGDFEPNDADGDGIEDAADLCPGSTGAVDETGCAVDQESQIDDPDQLIEDPPPDGEVTDGLFPIVLSRDSDAPHVFLVPESDVVSQGPDEIQVIGDVSLSTPGGFVVMHNAALTFDTAEDTVSGTATIPLPGYGLFDDVRLEGTVQATVAYEPGSTLDELGVPLQPGRKYLHFRVLTGGALIADDLELSTDGPGALVIIDPMDPAIFMAGSLLGLDKLGPLEDATLGFSIQGLIPYRPLVDLGLPDFDGNVLVMGTTELPAVPLTVVGDTTVAITGPLAGQQDAILGANGTLFLTQDVLGIPVLDLELGAASAVVNFAGGGARAFYKGEPTEATFTTLPLAANFTSAEGAIFENDGGTFDGVGDIVIDGSFLSDLLIVPIPDIPLGSADLHADDDGVTVGGPLAGELALPGVTVAGGAGAEAVFQPDLSDWEIRLTGAANVGGQDLLDQLVIIDPDGVRVE